MVTTRTVSVGAGAHVEIRTKGVGESLVLIQTALSPEQLVPLSNAPAIVNRFHVIDCRRQGYGLSSSVDGPGSVARDANDCLTVLRDLDVTSAHILGTSYSGAVALEVAATAPEMVATLTLIEPPPLHGPPAAEFLASNRDLIGAFERDGVTAALELFTQRAGAPSWLAERAEASPEIVAENEQNAKTFFTADVPALLDWQFDADPGRDRHLPVLYIGGTASHPWFSHVHRWVTETFPQCEDHLIEGAGHSVVATHTKQVSQLLAEFLSRHPIT